MKYSTTGIVIRNCGTLLKYNVALVAHIKRAHPVMHDFLDCLRKQKTAPTDEQEKMAAGRLPLDNALVQRLRKQATLTAAFDRQAALSPVSHL